MIERIPLGSRAFEGDNNVYLLETASATALIDTGTGTSGSQTRLEDALDDLGYALEDVTDVFITHFHSDHSGLAGTIQARSSADLYVHEADVQLVRQDADARDELRATQQRRFEEWHIPREPREELEEILDTNDTIGPPPTSVQAITDDETFSLGESTLEAVHLPGHTAGLAGFALAGADGREVLFSGDALLPHYTPNVGGADVRVDRPLERYLSSLRRIIDRDFERVWPGHRQVISDPAERASTIMAHHNERTERVYDAVASLEPVDTWTVSAELFGSLSSIHILHGPGEAHAHLTHLVEHDVLAWTDDGYVTAAPKSELESVLSPVPSR